MLTVHLLLSAKGRTDPMQVDPMKLMLILRITGEQTRLARDIGCKTAYIATRPAGSAPQLTEELKELQTKYARNETLLNQYLAELVVPSSSAA